MFVYKEACRVPFFLIEYTLVCHLARSPAFHHPTFTMPAKKNVSIAPKAAPAADAATVVADVVAPTVAVAVPVAADAAPVASANDAVVADAAAPAAAATKKVGRAPAKKTAKGGKKAVVEDEDDKKKKTYKMLAFDNGKVRVVGAYMGKSPSQAAKKAVKHNHTDSIYLRQKGARAVYHYVGSNVQLDKPVFGYVQTTVGEDGKPKRVVIKTNLQKPEDIEKLKKLGINPDEPAFTHSKVPVVRRVGFWPAGLD